MKTKQCGYCGGRNMTADTRDQSMVYKVETITVASLPGWYCPDCGECEFTAAADAQRFSGEVVEAMKRIDTAQRVEVRAIRKRLGLKQSEASALFGGGINAFSEYERGIRQPAKSTLLLLKLLDIHPELLPEIRATVGTGAKTIRDFRGSVTGSGDPEQERRTAKDAVSRRIIGEI